MTSRDVTVQVRQPDGTLKPQTRTLYSTRYGPVFDLARRRPAAVDADDRLRDARRQRDNFRIFNHFFATDRAQSAQQELDILKRYEGIPWVNTIVADKGGNALYADIGAIPHVTNAQAQQCNTGARRGDVHGCSACRCSTGRARRATGAATPTPCGRGSSARASCRTCSATTT